MNFWTIFITGLFAGGLTCLALQGGLLAAAAPFSVTAFLLARLIGYTFLGLLLGSLGSAITISLGVRITIQVLISIFMIGTALNLLQVHPIFRYFVISPPKFLARFVRTESKLHRLFSPVILGLLTVLIPCGATQAMMGYAVSTASPILGATVMFTFILGTTPLFVLLGIVTKKMTSGMSIRFNQAAAAMLIILAIYSLDGAVALSGQPYTLSHLAKAVSCQISFCEEKSVDPVTSAEILFTSSGYRTNPVNITVKTGSQVDLKLINNNASGCIQAFTIPSLKYQKIVSPGSTAEYTFTAPSEPGQISFMCGMGMYRGSINVI